MKVITTIPPYAPYLEELAVHPLLEAVRLNTVMPTKGKLKDLLLSLKATFGEKPIWVDLKCRQIRVSYGMSFKAPDAPKKYVIDGKDYIADPSTPRSRGRAVAPPWAYIKIDRKIKLDFTHGPIKCWFNDGTDCAQLVEINNGDELIMLDGPKTLIGGGMSINIVHPSLEIEGFFTARDLEYIEAAKEADMHHYMLSFVESEDDINQLLKLDPQAIIAAKIESHKGVDFVKEFHSNVKKYEGTTSRLPSWLGGKKSAKTTWDNVRLMTARGDLYNELAMRRAEKILAPMSKIIQADPHAILASRVFNSLVSSPRPSCSDVTDIAYCLSIGYKTFMIGDDICFGIDKLMLALDILGALEKELA